MLSMDEAYERDSADGRAASDAAHALRDLQAYIAGHPTSRLRHLTIAADDLARALEATSDHIVAVWD